MKALVVADSVYGNTRRIGEAIAAALDGARFVVPADVDYAELAGLDLLIAGAPTQGGRPTQPAQAFLRQIPRGALDGVNVCAFDTRVEGRGFLRVVTAVLGFAAPRIARGLRAKGGRLALPPEGFIVEGTEGPLKQGELERAVRWAAGIAARLHAASTPAR